MDLLKSVILEGTGALWNDLDRYEAGNYSRLAGIDFEGAVYLDRMRAVYEGAEFDWHGGGPAYTKTGFRLEKDEKIEKIRVDFVKSQGFIYNIYFDTNKRVNLGFSSYDPDIPKSEIIQKECVIGEEFEVACLEGGAELCTGTNYCVAGLTVYSRRLEEAGYFDVAEADTDDSTLLFISQENSSGPAVHEEVSENYHIKVTEDTAMLTAFLYSGNGHEIAMDAPAAMRVIDPKGREMNPETISAQDYIYLSENGDMHGITLIHPIEGTWEIVVEAARSREFRCDCFLYSLEDDMDELLNRLKKLFPKESEDELKERLLLPLILNIGSVKEEGLSAAEGKEAGISPYEWWKICDMAKTLGKAGFIALVMIVGIYGIYYYYKKKKLEELLKIFNKPYRVKARKVNTTRKFWKRVESKIPPVTEWVDKESVLKNRLDTRIVENGFNDKGFVIDRAAYEQVYAVMPDASIYVGQKNPPKFNPMGKHLEVDLGGEGRYNDKVDNKVLKCGFRKALNLNARLHNYYNKNGIPLLVYMQDFSFLFPFPFVDGCVDIFYKQGVGCLYRKEADEMVRCLKDDGMILAIDVAVKKNVPVDVPPVSRKDWEDPYNPGLSEDYRKYSNDNLVEYLDEDLLAIYCYIADHLLKDIWLIGDPESEDRSSVLVCIK